MTAETTTTAEKSAEPVPPQEKFWRRYSPHGEAPLSVAGSLGLHLAVGGFLLLAGFYLLAGFNAPRPTIPIVSVDLAPGGGGGKPGGDGGPPLAVTNLPDEDPGREPAVNPLIQGEATPTRPPLNPIEREQIERAYDAADVRPIFTTESGKPFARLDERIRGKLAEGLRLRAGEGDGPGGKPGPG